MGRRSATQLRRVPASSPTSRGNMTSCPTPDYATASLPLTASDQSLVIPPAPPGPLGYLPYSILNHIQPVFPACPNKAISQNETKQNHAKTGFAKPQEITNHRTEKGKFKVGWQWSLKFEVACMRWGRRGERSDETSCRSIALARPRCPQSRANNPNSTPWQGVSDAPTVSKRT